MMKIFPLLWAAMVLGASMPAQAESPLPLATESTTDITPVTAPPSSVSEVADVAPPTATLAASAQVAAPRMTQTLDLAQLSSEPTVLRADNPNAYMEFGVARDQLVTRAVLNLAFTPSPSLVPLISQMQLFLNDELISVIPVDKAQLGQASQLQIPIDAHYITDFNRIRLAFVGRYQPYRMCENEWHPTLWLAIGKNSSLTLETQALAVQNDLALFPRPFFDRFSKAPLTLPMVFAAQPDLAQQQAAAVLASWFGVQAQWRGQRFPVLYNQLPDRHGVVFATNSTRPDFLRDYPAVKGPTVAMISSPDNPYIKLLLILGRDDNDLMTAVRGLAQGNALLRGERVAIDQVETLAPRQPYDAPNWVPTDRPVTFAELQSYDEQLQSVGIRPAPISLTLNLPPDLFLPRNAYVDMNLKYRYTQPPFKDGSRMAVSINRQFVQAFPLLPSENEGKAVLHIPLIQGLIDKLDQVTIPAVKLGIENNLRFDFDYVVPYLTPASGECVSYQPLPNTVAIDKDSTLNLSGFRHFLAMPNLRSFANAGFPFSRLADLSQTLVVVAPKPSPIQVSTLLATLGNIGAQTGYPALAVTLSDDLSQASAQDRDILLIGRIPPTLRDADRVAQLVNATQSWLISPMNNTAPDNTIPDPAAQHPAVKTTLSAQAPLAVIVGFESPFSAQRSVVALLADDQAGYGLLNEALIDKGKTAAMYGSVAVIRSSGVNSLRVGDIYYVGHLPWWERLWYTFSSHPYILAALALLAVVLVSLVLWRVPSRLRRRRLESDERR
ncbi:cellulose biosynthesis cyclic di-GMP-binding regulatory protein BcsB [Edwardsiella hoshinae]|uniref:Cyclic di-GMP-binding protein n=1 Tax=Edwardsiella hoshinae TaxID=93378 RepID=A0A376D6K7_9GAMM|nr:cellulose biosynthesis cyclic di-GMP-binding regulatory protein BcsB [Edwardsiella hoshinae]QPR28582.1 cellulose biosynthesis cyclic di-GMP-binding regulatory protein BcsB [Edwardsiella hoshinae]STC82737.1 Cellulose synthase regulatory subunit [Edwardsiella hoshinae]